MRVTEVEVLLDDESIFRGPLPVGAAAGAWGVGAQLGAAHFRTVERIPAP